MNKVLSGATTFKDQLPSAAGGWEVGAQADLEVGTKLEGAEADLEGAEADLKRLDSALALA